MRVLAMATLWLVAAAATVGCSSYYLDKMVTVRVRDTGGAAMGNLQITVWVADARIPVGSRSAIEQEPLVSDSRGQASWVVETEDFYICGYRIEDAAGAEVLYVEPNVAEFRSTPSGIVDVVI